MTTNGITINHELGIRVSQWHNQNDPTAICIRQGKFFIRIPLANAYDVVNAVHDLAERIEKENTVRTSGT